MGTSQTARGQEEHADRFADHPRYQQLRADVDDGYGLLRKNSKTLEKHTKTLGKHGTSLRWIKHTQADHTVRFERLQTRLDGLETRLDKVETRLSNVETRLSNVETRLSNVETKLDTIIGLLGNR